MIDHATQLLLFDNMPDDGFVCWLKVPAYQVQWLMAHYGFPVCLPTYTHMAFILRHGLVRNDTRRHITDTCMTNVMFQRNDFSMEEEERLQFVPLALPKYIHIGNGRTTSDSTFQLTAIAARDMREEMRRIYWADLCSYIVDNTYHCACQHLTTNLDQQLDEWMEQNGIDFAFHDTIIRQYYRDVQNGENERMRTLQETAYRLEQRQEDIISRLRERYNSPRAQYLRLRAKMRTSKSLE